VLETLRLGEVTQFKMATLVGDVPVYWVAAYLVDGLLIDSGCANTAAEFLAALETEAAAGRPVRTVLNTHYHEDHIGANRELRERFGCRILAHPWAVPLLADPPQLPDYRDLVWGRPAGAPVEPAPAVLITQRHRFLIVDTPGHCPGHLSVVEPARGWCFSGDLFIGEQPRVAWRETDVTDMIESLDRLGHADVSGEGRLVLYTAPGQIVFDGRPGLHVCAGFLRDCRERARGLRAAGLSDESIRDRLFRVESSFAALTRGEFSALNLTRALLRDP
jgi:hydroxyacylglutathione hydrolase